MMMIGRGFNVCYSYDNENWKRTKTIVKTKKKIKQIFHVDI